MKEEVIINSLYSDDEQQGVEALSKMRSHLLYSILTHAQEKEAQFRKATGRSSTDQQLSRLN